MKATPWKPKDVKIDAEREAKLKETMEMTMKRVESSKFYSTFLEQLKSPEVSDKIRGVLGTETQLQMVIYGIGRIEPYTENPSFDVKGIESSRLQLSVALLMRREFDWVGKNIEVFDPVLSATECSIIESLGCTVLSVNEKAHRVALKPTLFFMPHCERFLYENLLKANWRTDRVSRIVLLGNSLQWYAERVRYGHDDFKGIIAVRRITSEFAIDTVSDHNYAFHGLSWQFFNPGIDSEMPLLVSDDKSINFISYAFFLSFVILLLVTRKLKM